MLYLLNQDHIAGTSNCLGKNQILVTVFVFSKENIKCNDLGTELYELVDQRGMDGTGPFTEMCGEA